MKGEILVCGKNVKHFSKKSWNDFTLVYSEVRPDWAQDVIIYFLLQCQIVLLIQLLSCDVLFARSYLFSFSDENVSLLISHN